MGDLPSRDKRKADIVVFVVILLAVALAVAVGYAAWQRRELREVEKQVLDNDNLQIENETLRRDKAAREARLELVLGQLRVDNENLRREKAARESSLVMVLAELDHKS